MNIAAPCPLFSIVIDFVALQFRARPLRELHDVLQRWGVRLDLSELKAAVLDSLDLSGWRQWFKGEVFFSQDDGHFQLSETFQ